MLVLCIIIPIPNYVFETDNYDIYTFVIVVVGTLSKIPIIILGSILFEASITR